MPSIPADQFAQNLQQTNLRLRVWLERLNTDPANLAASPELISSLLSELLQVGECLRASPHEQRSPALQSELAEYRRNLERLRGWMPAIHSHLLEERARLEAERSRVSAAEQWAHGSRQTL